MNPEFKEKTVILLGVLLLVLFVAYAPVVSKTSTTMVEVTVPKPGSPTSRQTLELTTPLTSATFHIQALDLPYDQTVNVSVSGSAPTDLVAILSITSSEGFIQTLISEVGIPIGPSLFTGKDLTPVITAMIKEKLPSIMNKVSKGDYYKINTREDAASLALKSGKYNLIILSLGHTGKTNIRLEYLSAESIKVTQPQTVTKQVSILGWLTA